jgi:hypothetical protein
VISDVLFYTWDDQRCLKTTKWEKRLRWWEVRTNQSRRVTDSAEGIFPYVEECLRQSDYYHNRLGQNRVTFYLRACHINIVASAYTCECLLMLELGGTIWMELSEPPTPENLRPT